MTFKLPRCVAINLYDQLGRKDQQCVRDGHYVEQGDPWCWQHRPSLVAKETRETRRDRAETEADRLRAVNTILLEALEGLFTTVGEALIEGDFDQSDKADIEAQHELARAIIEANK